MSEEKKKILKMVAEGRLTPEEADRLLDAVKDARGKRRFFKVRVYEKDNREKPKVKISRGFPFIPKEEELDSLIAGSGKKNASFLQTLKETAMRAGEAKRLMWININLEENMITLNNPEKGSKSNQSYHVRKTCRRIHSFIIVH